MCVIILKVRQRLINCHNSSSDINYSPSFLRLLIQIFRINSRAFVSYTYHYPINVKREQNEKKKIREDKNAKTYPISDIFLYNKKILVTGRHSNFYECDYVC